MLSCFNLEGWVKELSCLVDTFVEIRTTEESVARRHIEIRKRWGMFSFIPRTWSLLVKVRRGRPESPRTGREIGKRLCGWPFLTTNVSRPLTHILS